MGDTTARDQLADADRPHLLVILDQKVSTHAMPSAGTLVIGRGAECDVRIDSATISRRHARLQLGERLAIEDLGSANGTRVRERALTRGKPVAIEPGETIEVGAALVIVQRGIERRRSHRVWTHGYFEARLEDECARADSTGAGLAVVRIACPPEAPRGLIEERIAGELREGDVLGVYTPGEYEALLLETGPDEAERRAQSMGQALRRVPVKARVGVVCRPRDGHVAHQLLATACAAVSDARPASASPRSPVIAAPVMRRLFGVVEKLAAGDLTVLVRGETGVGKELVAEALHRSSPRARAPLVRVNLAAVAASLIESELFGHQRGAFTGAVRDRPGLIESADGGTLFLDEIGELDLAVQVKLLRVLEDRRVTRIGSIKPRTVDVRFVAATHRDLEAAVAAGSFREDLFYRLTGVTVQVPPLRDRPEELAPLVRAFVEDAALRARRPVPRIADAVWSALEGYHWPGNIRELRNVVERAVLLAGERIEPEHLPLEKLEMPTAVVAAPPLAVRDETAPDTSLRRDLAAVERQHIIDALTRCGGNQTAAARLLGMSRRTLSSRLDVLDIARPRKGR